MAVASTLVWPLVGRDDELAFLRRSRRGGGAILSGSAGVGKSRLAAEAVERSEQRSLVDGHDPCQRRSVGSAAGGAPSGARRRTVRERRPVRTRRPRWSGRWRPRPANGRCCSSSTTHICSTRSRPACCTASWRDAGRRCWRPSGRVFRHRRRSLRCGRTAWSSGSSCSRCRVSSSNNSSAVSSAKRWARAPSSGSGRRRKATPSMCARWCSPASRPARSAQSEGTWRWQRGWAASQRVQEIVAERLGRLDPDEQTVLEALAVGGPLPKRPARRPRVGRCRRALGTARSGDGRRSGRGRPPGACRRDALATAGHAGALHLPDPRRRERAACRQRATHDGRCGGPGSRCALVTRVRHPCRPGDTHESCRRDAVAHR